MQLPKLRITRTPAPERDTTFSLQGWADYVTQFVYNGNPYTVTGGSTLGGKEETPDASFRGYVQTMYKQNGVVFACMACRQLLFAEARFQFRQLRSGRPGNLFGDKALGILERPWQNGTTGDLLSRMIQDADLAGNAYVCRQGNRLVRLRPDWVTIVIGSRSREDAEIGDLDADVLGYWYEPGGQGSERPGVPLRREQVAHFAPHPDPEASYRGMSWLTPVIREVMADGASTSHKLSFFENGATPNMVMKLDTPAKTPAEFQQWVDVFDAKYGGYENAYKTLWLAAGSDAQVVGANMKQIDFKVTQGAGETRIAAASGMAPIIVGFSEGLESATYSNYGQAKRRVADGTLRPLWRNAAGSLSSVIEVPDAAELWYDDRDIPFLQEDQKDAAEVMHFHAQTLKALTEAGYTKDSAVEAVMAGDFSRLEDTGMTSVQLLPPGQPANGNGSDPATVGQGDS